MYPRGPNQHQRPVQQTQRPVIQPQRAPIQQQRTQLAPRNQPSLSQETLEQQRRKVADKLIADCYSKRILDRSGKPCVETSYQTHVSIKEYSSFPSRPPPDNLPPSQIGTVKDRVLVLCIKYSGRVLIQKGKYNENKDVYQIGRTWDMDELKTITKCGKDGIILTLNKDYYWSVEGGAERVWKFARFLTNAYGGFMGRYPTLNGFSIEDFKISPSPQKKHLGNSSPSMGGNDSGNDIVVNEPQPHPQLLKTKSLKRKNLPKPVLPPQPLPQQIYHEHGKQNDFYKDMDFTANGKLPSKPMKVMQVDRPSTSSLDQVDNQNSSANKLNQSKELQNTNEEFVDNYITFDDKEPSNTPSTPKRESKHPYQVNSPLRSSDTTQDSQNFVFHADNTYSPEKLREYVKANEEKSTSPLRNYKPRRISTEVEQRKVSEPLESAAALGIRLEEQLHNVPDKDTSADSAHSFQVPARNVSPDYSIEEVENDSDEEQEPQRRASAFDSKQAPVNREEPITQIDNKSANTHVNNTIDSSIQDIENYMDSQLYFAPGDESVDNSRQISQNETLESNISQREISEDDIIPSLQQGNDLDFRGHQLEDETISTQEYTEQSEVGLNIDNKGSEFQREKDAELEEILDEVNWSISDNSDSLIRKLTKELNNVKFRNVKDLVTLDFSKDSVSNDVTTSLSEIENLTHIFKKMEIDFKFLGPEVNLIENNSKGLQVKSVNKKLLYNDLSSILNKVSMHSDDLRAIESFREFDRLNKLEAIEVKLVGLFNALETIRLDYNENTDSLSSMRALRQYQSNYEHVTASFIRHFSRFIKDQFGLLSQQMMQNMDDFYPQAMFRELNNLLIYSGYTYFVKGVSPSDFQDINGNFNLLMSDFLERMITHKLKNLKFSSSSVSAHLSQSLDSDMPLKKSRTLRLSTRREKHISKVNQEELQGLKQNKNSNEIDDPKAIVDIINSTRDVIFVLQYITGRLFHYDSNIIDFNEYCQNKPYPERRATLDNPSLDIDDDMSYSNDSISNLNAVFGGYINIFMKKVTPTELNIPLLLCYLQNLLDENKKSNQEFLCFNFLKKASDKFRLIWSKFIKSQLSLLNKSAIIAHCGILPAIKNVNQVLLVTESSLDQPGRLFGSLDQSQVRAMLAESYKEISEATIHLFMRDDPLLKNHDFDDKEREHRNVSIIQNIFYLTEQLAVFSSPGITKMRSQLNSVFNKVLESYFNKLLHKNIGKLVEFVDNYEALVKMNNGKPKKYNKKYVKSLLTGYTSKDVSVKAAEIFRKLEKHFITGSDMFEKDLLDKLWTDMEVQFIDYFSRLNNILKNDFDREIDYAISRQDIHSIFVSIH
ncbi:uncharacterized protein AC631_04422 [Debaryomyces fabryi]|uniref:Exocyst complex component Sec3 PIP2-binding N-terminal domain-containing protein n=1 Tax=Debaryomyces fabryi TaxID=58627 RepID=A0A0V1PUH3_9ASCO|nr:uncharacterized protein AC631_04422 [Debaryomyces fabryi]KRZ99826.1 hypothetical protein AC631_04422 [Debaryomyces fabryi]CUM47874.1 unnamed protein product [Debaryomyces fabryi]